MTDSSIPIIDTPSTAAQASRGVTLQSLASSTITSAAIFVVEVVIFLLLRRRLTVLSHRLAGASIQGFSPNMISPPPTIEKQRVHAEKAPPIAE